MREREALEMSGARAGAGEQQVLVFESVELVIRDFTALSSGRRLSDRVVSVCVGVFLLV